MLNLSGFWICTYSQVTRTFDKVFFLFFFFFQVECCHLANLQSYEYLIRNHGTGGWWKGVYSVQGMWVPRLSNSSFKLNEPHMHYQELLAAVQPDLVSRSGNYTGARLLYASAPAHIISWRRQEAATHTSLIKWLTVFLLLIWLSFYNANESLWPFLSTY